MKFLNWYYNTFVKWGDLKFVYNPALHTFWMITVGLPVYLHMLWIWYV